MMKRLLIGVALSLSAGSLFAQIGTWVPQNTGFPNTSSGVFNVSVVDENIVWISSYDGSGGGANVRDYSKTIDGGLTWIPGVIPAPAGYAWSMIHGLDDMTAWAVLYNATAGSGGGIWKTSDGGVTWNQQGVGVIYNTSGQSFPNVVHFWDANTGFAMGDPVGGEYEIYTTLDGGTTWTPVPGANIPAPLAGEYGIVDHYEVMGDTIWFDTNKGRVYRSIDKGVNWTVSSTGITVPTNNAIDIVFWNANSGLARLFNGTSGVMTVRWTSDGGTTWTAGSYTGNMLGNDIKYVPGSASRLVSTGANTNYTTGSSYSDDGGLTWTDIDIGTQRTALGIYDINTMWAGGFTTSPTSGGIFKYELLQIVACGDTSITPGVTSAPDSTICFGDTLFLTTNGAHSPNVGTVYGYALVLSSNDISGSTTPLGPTTLGGTGVVYPQPAAINTTIINNGNPFTAGVYYCTPVVFGNATGSGQIFNLTLDPNCTYSGTSVMITLYAQGDPACNTGISENAANLALQAYQPQSGLLNLNIGALSNRNLEISLADVTGRIVRSEKVHVNAGKNTHQMDITSLSAGTYAIRAGDGQGAVSVKFVKY